MKRLLLATTNAGKVRELRDLLAGCGWAILTPADAGISLDVEETGATYLENARLKAEAYARASGLPALADDSGLEIDALDGAPGLHSARYAGHDTTYADKIKALLDELRAVPSERRTARFRALVVVADPGGEVSVFEGVCEGRIAAAPRGTSGFGYDPIFLVADGSPPFSRTMAELSAEEKNRISHRARAAAAASAYLRTRADDEPSERAHHA